MAACASAIGTAVIAEVRFIAELDTFLWQSQSTGSRSIAAPRMLIADWFCGIGCFSLGAQRAGGVPVCAIEMNKEFRRCYKRSFGILPGTDVRTDVEQAAPLQKADSIDLVLFSAECSRFSQAAEQSGLKDPDTLALWTQVLLRLRLESPRAFHMENVRGLATANHGDDLHWILTKLRAVGYATIHVVGCVSMIGFPFKRPRLHVAGLRLDLAHRSWWARADPDAWFRPAQNVHFKVIRHMLHDLSTAHDELEADGAVFMPLASVTWLQGFPKPRDTSLSAMDLPFQRVHHSQVPPSTGLTVAEVYIVGTVGSFAHRLAERNHNRVFHIDGIGATMTRTGSGAWYFIPEGICNGSVRPAVVRTLTVSEIAAGWRITGLELPRVQGCLDVAATRVAVGQAVVPLPSERVASMLFSCIDSTIGRSERHIPRHLEFKPASRYDLISPDFDVVVARFQKWAIARDTAFMLGLQPKQPRLTMSIMKPFHGFVTQGMVVLDLQHYMHRSGLGSIWHCLPGAPPVRVAPRPISPHDISLMEALERKVFKDTSSELLAHTIQQRGCHTGSFLSTVRVYLGANTQAFCKHHDRALADVAKEVQAGCLRPMSGLHLEMFPWMGVPQSVTDKKLMAHLRALGVIPKVRRLADKLRHSDVLASTNSWVCIDSLAKLHLTRLDDTQKQVVALCAMANSLNDELRRQGKLSPATEYGVYLLEGDVERAYRNLLSCATEQWKSGMYVVSTDGKFTWLVDRCLDFGGRLNPNCFSEVAFALVQIWAATLKLAPNMLAPQYVVPAMETVRAAGFTKKYRMHHTEFRHYNGRPEQPVPVPLRDDSVDRTLPTVGSTTSTPYIGVDTATQAPAKSVLLPCPPSVRQTEYPRGKIAPALSHDTDVASSQDMWRLRAYLDDFGAAVVDTRDQSRVQVVHDGLRDAGSEVKLPFGQEKWEAGAPTQDLVSLGIGFNVVDPLHPFTYITAERIEELQFLLAEALLLVTMDEKALQSLAHKLQRAAMIVPQGRLYICGLFAAMRLVQISGLNTSTTATKGVASNKRRRFKTAKGRAPATTGHAQVPLTRWAKRNISWWKKYLAVGSREYCFMPKVTYPGDIEADACGHGFGGFYTVGTTMYFFAGVWSEAEKASFNSKAPLTLDINTLELATQLFLLQLGIEVFQGHTIMPKCDNDTSVVLKNSYKARSTHLAQLLEDYDHLSALHNVNVQMVHIPGEINVVSDVLSRDGVCEAFYRAVRTDFPHINSLQNVSELLPSSVRSLAHIMGSR